MGLLSFLFGSTAEVVLDDNTATKHYYDSASSQLRRNEIENLENLYDDLGNKGTVRVPALLSVGYGVNDSIDYIVTERVNNGWSLSQLRENGYKSEAKQAVKLAKQAIRGTGIHLPDLETDGNILVTIGDNGDIINVWLVDVGDIY